jgi:hypothetical protein
MPVVNTFSNSQINIKSGTTSNSTDLPGIYWVNGTSRIYDDGNLNVISGGNLHLAGNNYYFNATTTSGIRLRMGTNDHWVFGQDGGSGIGLLFQYPGQGYYVLSATGGGWVYNSDEKLKNNIVDVGPSLDKLLKLTPSHFEYKRFDDSGNEIPNPNAPTQCGFIAQNVEPLFPNCIFDMGIHRSIKQQTKGIQITNMIAYIVKAIQEQHALITNLTTQVNDLRNNVEQLTTQIYNQNRIVSI